MTQDGVWPPSLLRRANSRIHRIHDRRHTRSSISPQERVRNKLKPDVSLCDPRGYPRRLMFLSVLWKDYELVRVHHPDSAHCRVSDLPKRIRDERFSAIKDAYDVLTGKKPGNPSRWNSPDIGRDWELRSELERRSHRRASWGPQAYAYSQSHYGHQHDHSPPSNGPMTPEDRRRDNILICVAFAVRLNLFHQFSDLGNSGFM